MSGTLTNSSSRMTGRMVRRAFSLAEVMIAVGILGIGMIMVAATFPVGLDQARIVSDASLAPLVTREAFQTIEKLLNDPNPTRRIGSDADADDPTKAKVSFRQAMMNYLAIENAKYTGQGSESAAEVTAAFPVVAPADYPTYPTKPTTAQVRDINHWLESPTKILGCQARYYPSVSGEATSASSIIDGTSPLYRWRIKKADDSSLDPAYTWSVLFHRPGTTPNNSLEFFVFVNRLSASLPAMVRFTKKIVPNQEGHVLIEFSKVRVAESNWAGASNLNVSQFSPGTILIGLENGKIYKVLKVDAEAKTMELDESPGIGFWFMPPDSNTGKSPLVTVQKRIYTVD